MVIRGVVVRGQRQLQLVSDAELGQFGCPDLVKQSAAVLSPVGGTFEVRGHEWATLKV